MAKNVDILARLGDFKGASQAAREQATDALVEQLGDGWEAEAPDMNEDALSLVHVATRMRFAAVPGGLFEMGFTESDQEDAQEVMDWDGGGGDYVEELVATARPPHDVTVRPFLCARTVWRDGDKIVDADRAEALRVAAELGLRLPSEAELEWIGRDGGETGFILDAADEPDPEELRSRFGLTELHWFQWAADDWHASYDGAPGDSAAWMGGDPAGVYRSGFDLRGSQAEEDCALALAAVRHPGDDGQKCRIRLAWSIP
ncbi:MAG: hypothetical protein R3B70_05490 [Polyangiaceae bacterium]